MRWYQLWPTHDNLILWNHVIQLMSPKPPRKTLRWSLCGECTVTYSSIGQKIDLSRAKIKVYPIVCAISYNLQYRVCSFNMFQPCATQTCSAGEEGWSCRFFRPPIFLRILLIDFHTFSILFNYAIPSRIVRYPPPTPTYTQKQMVQYWIVGSVHLWAAYIYGGYIIWWDQSRFGHRFGIFWMYISIHEEL